MTIGPDPISPSEGTFSFPSSPVPIATNRSESVVQVPSIGARLKAFGWILLNSCFAMIPWGIAKLCARRKESKLHLQKAQTLANQFFLTPPQKERLSKLIAATGSLEHWEKIHDAIRHGKDLALLPDLISYLSDEGRVSGSTLQQELQELFSLNDTIEELIGSSLSPETTHSFFNVFYQHPGERTQLQTNIQILSTRRREALEALRTCIARGPSAVSRPEWLEESLSTISLTLLCAIAELPDASRHLLKFYSQIEETVWPANVQIHSDSIYSPFHGEKVPGTDFHPTTLDRWMTNSHERDTNRLETKESLWQEARWEQLSIPTDDSSFSCNPTRVFFITDPSTLETRQVRVPLQLGKIRHREQLRLLFALLHSMAESKDPAKVFDEKVEAWKLTEKNYPEGMSQEALKQELLRFCTRCDQVLAETLIDFGHSKSLPKGTIVREDPRVQRLLKEEFSSQHQRVKVAAMGNVFRSRGGSLQLLPPEASCTARDLPCFRAQDENVRKIHDFLASDDPIMFHESFLGPDGAYEVPVHLAKEVFDSDVGREIRLGITFSHKGQFLQRVVRYHVPKGDITVEQLHDLLTTGRLERDLLLAKAQFYEEIGLSPFPEDVYALRQDAYDTIAKDLSKQLERKVNRKEERLLLVYLSRHFTPTQLQHLHQALKLSDDVGTFFITRLAEILSEGESPLEHAQAFLRNAVSAFHLVEDMASLFDSSFDEETKNLLLCTLLDERLHETPFPLDGIPSQLTNQEYFRLLIQLSTEKRKENCARLAQGKEIETSPELYALAIVGASAFFSGHSKSEQLAKFALRIVERALPANEQIHIDSLQEISSLDSSKERSLTLSRWKNTQKKRLSTRYIPYGEKEGIDALGYHECAWEDLSHKENVRRTMRARPLALSMTRVLRFTSASMHTRTARIPLKLPALTLNAVSDLMNIIERVSNTPIDKRTKEGTSQREALFEQLYSESKNLPPKEKEKFKGIVFDFIHEAHISFSEALLDLSSSEEFPRDTFLMASPAYKALLTEPSVENLYAFACQENICKTSQGSLSLIPAQVLLTKEQQDCLGVRKSSIDASMKAMKGEGAVGEIETAKEFLLTPQGILEGEVEILAGSGGLKDLLTVEYTFICQGKRTVREVHYKIPEEMQREEMLTKIREDGRVERDLLLLKAKAMRSFSFGENR